MLACHAGGLGSIPRRCKVILFKLNWFMISIKARIVTHIIYSLCSAATIHRMVNWFLNTFYWIVFDFAIGSTYYNTITVINFLLPKLETFLFRSTTYVQCNLLTLSSLYFPSEWCDKWLQKKYWVEMKGSDASFARKWNFCTYLVFRVSISNIGLYTVKLTFIYTFGIENVIA